MSSRPAQAIEQHPSQKKKKKDSRKGHKKQGIPSECKGGEIFKNEKKNKETHHLNHKVSKRRGKIWRWYYPRKIFPVAGPKKKKTSNQTVPSSIQHKE